MKVLDPGHQYYLDVLDSMGPGMVLTFVKREGENYPGNSGRHPGTTIQEVLRALIDRVKYLDNQIPHVRNSDTLRSLRRAIFDLEVRAAERHNRLHSFNRLVFNSILDIETIPVCQKCLHIGCEGDCHP